MARGERLAVFLTPVLAVATLAVGLRIGAGSAVHAALLYAAPPARDQRSLVWQLVTLANEGAGRETEPRRDIRVRATSKGREATWAGDTNGDGVAEVTLDLPGIARGDPVDVVVTAGAEESPETLAAGRVTWDPAAWMNSAPGPFAKPSKREGAVALDVAILGEKLVVRGEVPIWVRATARDDGRPLTNVAIVPEPDPGLDIAPARATTCALGWTRLRGSPRIFLAALALHATVPDGRTGEWYGALPVATGMVHAIVPDVSDGGVDFTIFGRSGVYTEVDDDEGRAFAKYVEGSGESTGTRVSAPSLMPGLKWLVTSSEARGAEVMDEGTIARPFLVEGKPRPPYLPDTDDGCAVGAYLAMHPAGGFRRWIALDGFLAREKASDSRHTVGVTIALVSLAVASVLELLLLVRAAARGKAVVRRLDGGMEGADLLVKRSSAVGVAIGVTLALLGFGLLAALVMAYS